MNHKSDSPSERESTPIPDVREFSSRVADLLRVVRPLVASSEPEVVLPSLARLCVPAFSDGCSVEIHTSDARVYRIRYPRGPTHRFCDGVRKLNLFETDGDFAAVLRVPVARPTNAFGPDYHGELVFVWKHYQPGRSDQRLAELLVERAQQIIEERRIAEALAEAEATTERLLRRASEERAELLEGLVD